MPESYGRIEGSESNPNQTPNSATESLRQFIKKRWILILVVSFIVIFLIVMLSLVLSGAFRQACKMSLEYPSRDLKTVISPNGRVRVTFSGYYQLKDFDTTPVAYLPLNLKSVEQSDYTLNGKHLVINFDCASMRLYKNESYYSTYQLDLTIQIGNVFTTCYDHEFSPSEDTEIPCSKDGGTYGSLRIHRFLIQSY